MTLEELRDSAAKAFAPGDTLPEFPAIDIMYCRRCGLQVFAYRTGPIGILMPVEHDHDGCPCKPLKGRP